uniref:Uncharacterized protein n=1 Tax=Glossina austeni TaxID=7395 RepID=A0A1A9VG27_GLOAU
MFQKKISLAVEFSNSRCFRVQPLNVKKTFLTKQIVLILDHSALPEISTLLRNYSWSVLEMSKVHEILVQVTDIAAVIPKYSFNIVKFFCSGNGAVASSISNSSTPIRAHFQFQSKRLCGIHLRKHQKCRNVPPEWMDIELLEESKRDVRVVRDTPVNMQYSTHSSWQ